MPRGRSREEEEEHIAQRQETAREHPTNKMKKREDVQSVVQHSLEESRQNARRVQNANKPGKTETADGVCYICGKAGGEEKLSAQEWQRG